MTTTRDEFEQAATAGAPSQRGLWLSLLVGVLFAMALGLTLLTWALSLLFMLGLFFFMLFGLLIGAAMYRAGAKCVPADRRRVVLITGVAALVGWATAVAKESHDFPRDFVFRVMEKSRYDRTKIYIPPGEESYRRVEEQVRSFITDHMKTAYPPGGIRGYLKYAVSGEEIVMDLPGQPALITVPPPAPAWVWCTRVLLALPLLFFTTYSVTGGLCRLPRNRRRSADGEGQGGEGNTESPGEASAPQVAHDSV